VSAEGIEDTMIEAAATVIITASSVLLFGYWFRYTCLLILSAKTTRDYAGEVAAANQLHFREIQAELQRESNVRLDELHAKLDRDYAVVTSLLGNVTDTSSVASPIEMKMLEINYKVMSSWYSVSKRFSATSAHKALEEMASVVAHFANAMGERAQAAGAAA
jgi:hypothetical protein